MKKLLSSIICIVMVLCLTMSIALAGTSIPSTSKVKSGSHDGQFNSLGTTTNYSNYNVQPTSSGMSFWVTGALNKSGATSNLTSGAGLAGNSSTLVSTTLYNFSDTTSPRNNNYSYSFSTSSAYWCSFKLSKRSTTCQLVGQFTFKSN